MLCSEDLDMQLVYDLKPPPTIEEKLNKSKEYDILLLMIYDSKLPHFLAGANGRLAMKRSLLLYRKSRHHNRGANELTLHDFDLHIIDKRRLIYQPNYKGFVYHCCT